MAYVRTRATRAGTVSTTLVEAYRDETGRPRQRISPIFMVSQPRCGRWPSSR
jgi:hypothetical protein